MGDSDEPKTGGNPDPTMRPTAGSPKGENMPPAGGESMTPADDAMSEDKTSDQRETTPDERGDR